MVVQNGVNKKIKVSTFLKTLDSSDTIKINPSRNFVNFQISSVNSPYLLFSNSAADFIGIDTSNPQAKFHVNGNIKIGSSTSDGILIDSDEALTFTLLGDAPQGVGYYKTISTSRNISSLTVETGVGVGQFSVGNGLVGQNKTITLVSVPSGSKATLQVLNGVGFTKVDLTAAGQSVSLKCINIAGIPKWICTSQYLSVLY